MGNRTKIFTKQGMITTVAASVGPMLSAFGFYALGDKWGQRDMKIINIAGQCVLPFACWTLLFLRLHRKSWKP